MAKYIIVEITDCNPSALKILRKALHRAASDHDIRCRDMPVTENWPQAYIELQAFFRQTWRAGMARRSRLDAESRAQGW